jgi:hypothetical protein
MRKRYIVKHALKKQLTGEACYYCGLHADARDHVIPVSVWRSYESLGLEPPKQRILIVPCCSECNSLLGASIQETLADRKKAIKKILRKRYAKILAMPEWYDDELEALSPKLQEWVRASIAVKEAVKERLEW